MKKDQIITFCAGLERQLDECLFASKDEKEKKGSTAAEVAKGTATVAAGGAAYLGHRKIMSDYGGDASGSVREAYRNAGRSAVQTVAAPAKAAVQTVKGGATAAATRAGKSYRTAREVAGLGMVGAGARAAKKAVNPALAKLRGILTRLP